MVVVVVQVVAQGGRARNSAVSGAGRVWRCRGRLRAGSSGGLQLTKLAKWKKLTELTELTELMEAALCTGAAAQRHEERD